MKKYWKLIALILIIIVIAISFNKMSYFFTNANNLLQESGNLAIYIYIALMILAILISPIPSSPLVIIAGNFFGPLNGMIYTLIGATIGAILALAISRFFLHQYLSKKLESNSFYQKIKGKNNHNILFLIFLSRLMPYISFDAISYAAGLTKVNIGAFGLVTFLGMIPIVFLLSFFGLIIQPFLPIIFLSITILFIINIWHSIKKKSLI